MNISRTPKYLFENDILQFESLINDFTDTIYDEFDAISKELEVKQKIDDLFEGELVNYTENRAATHPYERKRHKLYHFGPGYPRYFSEQNAKERAFFQFARKINFEATPTWLESWLLPYKKVNLITLGIGGSYEGPKLLKESMSSKLISEKIEHHFITGSDKKEFDSKIEKLDPKKTFFIVFSKSFLTQETVELFKEAITWSKDHDKFLFITSNPDEVKKYECFGKRFDENPMENSIYTFDETIGGRYSIWLDIISNIYGDRNFIEGGRRADQHLIDSSDYLNFVKRLSYTDIWNHNTKEKNVAPINIKNTILVSFIVSTDVFLIIVVFSFFLYIDSKIEPATPRDAASEGVAIPNIIDPRTIIIKNTGGISDLNKLMFLLSITATFNLFSLVFIDFM